MPYDDENSGGGGDFHRLSFDAGYQLVYQALPQIFDQLNPNACPDCLGRGAMAAAIEYAVFMGLDIDETEISEKSKDAMAVIVEFSSQEGLKRHLKYLETLEDNDGGNS